MVSVRERGSARALEGSSTHCAPALLRRNSVSDPLWQQALLDQDLKSGQVVKVSVAGMKIMLVRLEDGTVTAASPICPHQGEDLPPANCTWGPSTARDTIISTICTRGKTVIRVTSFQWTWLFGSRPCGFTQPRSRTAGSGSRRAGSVSDRSFSVDPNLVPDREISAGGCSYPGSG